MKDAQLPRFFQSLGALRALNVAAVGLALAAAASPAITMGLGDLRGSSSGGLFIGVPTLVCGMVWAALLRWKRKIAKTKIRVGWLASLPLASINAGLAFGATLAFSIDSEMASGAPGFLLGFFLAATVGVIAWLPALLATLLCFGLPIAKSHTLAEKGMAGEERGERIVGIASAVVSVIGLLSTLTLPRHDTPGLQETAFDSAGHVALFVFAIGGILTGGLATYFAGKRKKRRDAFVAEVEAGHVDGYRVDTTEEGRVLLRVTSYGEGYRVANFEEPVYEEPVSDDASQRLARRA